MTQRRGIVLVDEGMLLSLLHFEGGRIESIRESDLGRTWEIDIAHADMPEFTGEKPKVVNVEYMCYWGSDGGLLKIERMEPRGGMACCP